MSVLLVVLVRVGGVSRPPPRHEGGSPACWSAAMRKYRSEPSGQDDRSPAAAPAAGAGSQSVLGGVLDQVRGEHAGEALEERHQIAFLRATEAERLDPGVLRPVE